MNEDRIKRIFARRSFGIKPGLATTRALLAELDHPEKGLAVVHVAGTNGKGSVSALIASVLQHAGLKTGLYTSPHLIALNERFQINGVAIDDATLDPLLEEVESAAERVEASDAGVPTFFECVTALAVLWFSRSGVALAVMETGMGGRLDATNVLSPLLSVVTRIGIDHMAYLGNTLEAIASEKAGIVKAGVPVVCGAMPEAARGVIEVQARKVGAPLIQAEDVLSVSRVSGNLYGQKLRISSAAEDYGVVNIKLPAAYQVENVATAVTAIEALAEVLGVSFGRKTLVKGLSAAVWPGRFQCVGEHPDVIVDGAHNPDGAAALVAALVAAKCGKAVRFVVGQCDDKDSDGFFRAIASACGGVWTVPLDNPRSTPPDRLAALAIRYGITAVPCETLEEGLSLAKASALKAGVPVVVCGSLFLLGAMLGVGPANRY